MTTATRTELVDSVMNAILVYYRNIFPVTSGVDVGGVGEICGHPYKDNFSFGVNEPSNDEVLGESFNTIVRSCVSWLTAEGYLLVMNNSYTLSKRGARLAQCLPATLDVD